MTRRRSKLGIRGQTGRLVCPRILAFAVLAAVGAGALGVSAPAAAEEPAGQVQALILGALPGSPVYARRYRDWLKRFHAYLTQTRKVPAANVVVLSGDAEFKDPCVQGLATLETAQKAFADFAARTRPGDQFILILIGHGVVTEPVPTLVLPGRDLSVAQIEEGLSKIAARNQVVLNFSSSSGACLKRLARRGRVNLTAVKDQEATEPVYAEFFLRGLESQRADGEGAPEAGARDGVLTVLEAYNWATHQTALWISRQSAATPDGPWKLDGKESVEIFEKLTRGAEKEMGARHLDPESDRNKPDAVVEIVPASGKLDESWNGRRVVTETAMLEDCGDETGLAALQPEGYKPIPGQTPGKPGGLARRVVLGQAAPLKAGDK
jgi:hypothetical protein